MQYRKSGFHAPADQLLDLHTIYSGAVSEVQLDPSGVQVLSAFSESGAAVSVVKYNEVSSVRIPGAFCSRESS